MDNATLERKKGRSSPLSRWISVLQHGPCSDDYPGAVSGLTVGPTAA